MKYNIRNIENKYIYLSLIVVLVIMYIWYTQKTIQALESDLNTKSNEQVLVEKISNYKNNIDTKTENIKRLEEEVKNIDTLFYNCYKTQLLRLADNLEYNIEYCKQENLEQFRGL